MADKIFGQGLNAIPLVIDNTAVVPEFGAVPTRVHIDGLALGAQAQADSTAVDVAGLVADFNALLAKLRTAGVLAA